jgi:hypothetical protein
MFKKLNKEIKLQSSKPKPEIIDEFMVKEEKKIEESLSEIAYATYRVAKGYTTETLAQKHGLSEEFIKEQLEKGTKIELKNISDLEEAKRIAMDNLYESPYHYKEMVETESKRIEESRLLYETYLNILEEEKLPPMEEREFGVPEEKKFPLYDKNHVLAAIKFFNWVDAKYEEKLAHQIISKMKEHGLRKSNVGEDNKLSKYIKLSKLPD